MNSGQNRTSRVKVRWMMFFFGIFMLCAVLLIVKLACYQIRDYDYYQSKVLSQVTKQATENAVRGTITDRNGNILATNIKVYDVVVSPKDIMDHIERDNAKNSDNDSDNDVHYEFTDSDYGIYYSGRQLNEMIAEVLSKYLDVDKDTILAQENKAGRYYALIKKQIDADLKETIDNFISQFDIDNEIYFTESYKRYYPKGDLACHVIGFTNSEGVGVYGLEAYYNNLLEGTSGRYLLARDGKQNDMPFEFERTIEVENGYNLTTTLDMYIQYELENQLKKTYIESGAADRVCGAVYDVDTGEVLAMATYPSFDLNDPYTIDEYSQAELDASGLTEGSDEYKTEYNKLMYRMWNNKCLTETYEPGSTFKVVTSCMALEEGVITPETPFYCAGSLVVDGWSKPISCAEHSGHGAVTFRVGLQQSCNPTLMQVAALIGREKFYYYFKAFGYGGKTGIDLPGEVGTIYASYEDFSGVSLAVYSFGQTFKTTAAQQLRAITVVANGGYLVTPHLLLEITDDDGNTVQTYESTTVRQVVTEETCKTLTDILEEGVATDGAAKNAYVKGYRVAAKTGTSEKKDEFDENGNTPYRVGSTAAFAPADDPQISAIIVVDKPLKSAVYGGTVAAPYISNLLSYVLPYIGVEPQYTTDELAMLDVTLSNYIGSTVENATNDLSWRGFSYEIIGNGTTVTAQTPEAGAKISSDTGLLVLYTGDETPADTVEIPDLMGMSAYNANNTAVALDLNVTFYGSTNGSTATVINQYPAAGTKVPRGTIVEIELRHLDGTD